jgi:hypothetical protein
MGTFVFCLLMVVAIVLYGYGMLGGKNNKGKK